MRRLLFSVLLVANFNFSFAQGVSYTWLGATNMIFSFGDILIQLDPYTSRPKSLISALAPLDSDKDNAARWAKLVDVESLDAILITHTHFDHILDVEFFAGLGRPRIYGTKSAYNFSLGQGISPSRVSVVDGGDKFDVAQIPIKTIKLVHAPNFKNYTVFAGEIEEERKLPMPIWKMKEGGSLGYQFLLDDKKVFIHASSIPSPFVKDYTKLKSDILFISIANRKSTNDQIKSIISKVSPKLIIPIHYEGEFGELDPNGKAPTGDELEEWIASIKKSFPNMKIQLPKLAKWQAI